MIKVLNNETGFTTAIVETTEANMNNAELFKQELVAMLAPNKKIVLDLSNITYMDSSFLGALVASLKQALAINGDIVLAALQADIQNLFSLIRLDKVFKIYPDINQALAQ